MRATIAIANPGLRKLVRISPWTQRSPGDLRLPDRSEIASVERPGIMRQKKDLVVSQPDAAIPVRKSPALKVDAFAHRDGPAIDADLAPARADLRAASRCDRLQERNASRQIAALCGKLASSARKPRNDQIAAFRSAPGKNQIEPACHA